MAFGMIVAAALLGAVPAAAQLNQATQAAAQLDSTTAVPDSLPKLPDLPFFVSLENTPKAGVKANVRQNTIYGELVSSLRMRSQSSLKTTLKWSADEYRKQDKQVDKRSGDLTYGFGSLFPLITTLTGGWNWSEDRTTNTAGFNNLFAQDNRNLRLSATRTKYKLGGLTHSLNLGATVDDRSSENQGTANDSQEAGLSGGLQTGYEITQGVVLAGRIYGTTSSGERTLGAKDSPSSAQGDTLGLGIYFDRGRTSGLVSMTRANFERRFLDFNKNANGLIDTVGFDEDLKVVQELETKDAMMLEFDNTLQLGRFRLQTKASRTSDDLDYAASGQGLKERQMDTVALVSGYKVGVDSLTLKYDYGWKWDDQRIRGASKNRGRQYNKDRRLEFVWTRPLFAETEFKMRLYQGLSQDIAEFRHNENDKDRLQNDFSLELGRKWSQKLNVDMVYSFRSAEDRAIRATRSSNNNIKDSYEIAPNYTWYLAPWVTVNQVYKIYIQYTDYVYSGREGVSRKDNYNKRGNLTSKVTLYPTKRLQLVIRHDYNKKFNATRSGEDELGNVFYRRDLNQTISKLDLGLTFDMVPGVTLEAATYRTRDDRESLGTRSTETRDYSGEIWMGAKVNKTWRQDIKLSALVKKYNAFGPSVTESSADYWEADVWLQWKF